MWFGPWKWTGNSSAEGIVMATKRALYELKLGLTLKEGTPRIAFISSKRLSDEEERNYWKEYDRSIVTKP